jgi:lipid-A-disaccharide synthase
MLAVLPGSRRSEVERLSPVFTEACKLLLADDQTSDISFVAPMANSANRTMFEASVADAGIGDRMVILDGDSETALTAADVGLIASGTASLEAAMLATPMVVAYKVAPSTMAIARTFNLLKTDHVSLPNLLTDQPLVPEIIQEDATPEALYEALRDLLLDDERRRKITTTFSALRGQLAKGADRLAADAVMELVGTDG